MEAHLCQLRKTIDENFLFAKIYENKVKILR